MDRRAFVLVLAAIPAAAVAGLRPLTVLYLDGRRIPPLESLAPPVAADGGYLVPRAFAEEIAAAFEVPLELVAPAESSTYSGNAAELEVAWRQPWRGTGG